MNCALRKWRLSDAKDLAAALNSEKILNDLRDGLPFPYTEQDARDYIAAMRSSGESSAFAYAITIDDRAVGSIGASADFLQTPPITAGASAKSCLRRCGRTMPGRRFSFLPPLCGGGLPASGL